MKIKNFIGGFFMALLFVSCKEQGTANLDSTNSTKTEEVIDKEIFVVTLNVTAKKDDSFQIYYKDIEQGPFEEKKSMFIEFQGSEQPQEIVFKLPKNELPSFLRFDFGTNKDQSEIVVNSFKINYLDKSFESIGKDFFNYFYSNELVEVDKENSIVKPIVSASGQYDPIFCSAEGLKTQIDLIVQ